MRKFYVLFTILAMVGLSVSAQRTITGTVTSAEDGSTLPGVTVTVKGVTGSGTITDFNGAYSISVPTGEQTLQYSFVGMRTKEVITSNSTTIDVVMDPEDVQVSDVVVTAMGIKRNEKSIGYAVQSIGGDGVAEVGETNIVNALSGKISGVQVTNTSGAVGSSSRIVLRGASSITGNNEPLWVVDGVPINNSNYGNAGSGGGFDMPGGASDINPDDIESITVLKGANAAALYGSRAANGVILVKTKSGKMNKGLGVSVNSTTTFETPLRLPNFQNSYGQGNSNTFFEFVDGQNGDGDGVDESWGMPLDIGLEAMQFSSMADSSFAPKPWVSYPHNVSDFFQTGLTMTNNVAFSGGTDRATYRLSLTDSRQAGIVPNTEFIKDAVSGSSTIKLTDKLSSDFSVNYIKSTSDNLPTGGYNNENPVQQMIWSGRNVNFAGLQDYQNLPLAGPNTAAAGTPLNWNTIFQNNPYWVLDNNVNQLDKDRFIGNVQLTYAFNDWLSIRGRAGSDYWSSVVTQRKAIGSNEYPDGYYSEDFRTWYENNSDVLLMFQKDVSDDIDLTLNVGGNQMQTVYKRISGEAPQLELAGVYNLSNVKSGVTPTLSNYRSERRVNSIYFNGSVGFKRYIYLEFTGRNDWSSVLPTDNNSFFYPSVSLSAVITDMFGIESNTLSYLKLRGGWAQVGGDGALGPYALSQSYSFRDNPWGDVLLAYNGNTLNNPNLVSETTNSIEIGLDARFFMNRVRLDATYYDAQSRDLLVPVQVTAATGYTFAWDNVGEIRNRGIELQLGLDIVKSTDFGWELGVNWSKYNNEVVSLGGLESLQLGSQWGMSLQAREGESYGSIVGRDFRRSPAGDIIYEGGLPVVDNENKVLGTIQADWTGGVYNTFRVKGLEISALFDAKFGGAVHSMSSSWGRYAGVYNETLAGREDGVVGKGVMEVISGADTSYVTNNVVVSSESFNKQAFSNDVESSVVFDASYIKLRQVSVGYTLPNSIFGKLPLRDVSISVVGRNLALLYATVPHIDPETAFSSANGEQGQEFGQLPSTKSIGFNINFKF